MSYRVTNSMMHSLMLNDMHTNLSNLLDIQQQLSTQRKYQSASDNPNAVTKGMGLETMIVETEQYIANLHDAVSWLKFTDSALGDMNNIFQRMRELAIYAGDGILEDVDHNAIAVELTELRKELMSYANSTIAGEYLFAGLKTGSAPFTMTANGDIVYSGNDYSVKWEFSRQEVGKVSIAGSELFPEDEITNSLKGIELPLDFEWTGRNEILEFKVGWQTVKVRIPEKWEDELKNGVADSTDYNRYRDPGELEGYSLQEIADLINNSTEMGDVSKLLKAEVVTDTDRNVQYLVIKSHTGEAVRLTSWPETDPVAIPQGIKGAAYGPGGRIAEADGLITIRFDDSTTFEVEVEKGDDIKTIAQKLNDLPEGRLWAAFKTDDNGNEWIDIVSRDESGYFYADLSGGATALFAPEIVTVSSSKINSQQVYEGKKFSGGAYGFDSISDGTIIVTRGNDKYTIEIPAGTSLPAGTVIDNTWTPAPVPPLPSDITVEMTADGALKISSTNPDEAFYVTATGGAVPLVSDGVSATSSSTADSNGYHTLTTTPVAADFALSGGVNAAMCIERDGIKYYVPMDGTEDLHQIASKLEAALVAACAGEVPPPEVTVVDSVDDDGNVMRSLKILTASEIMLSGFGSGASVIGSHSIGSEEIATNTDHTHIGFAAFMGMETAVKSTEFIVGQNDTFDTVSDPLHIKFVSSSNSGEIYIEDQSSLSLTDLASRINSVCGTWLQAVVETDQPDGTDPLIDPLFSSGDNEEKATQRLVLRTLDGEPFAIYDGPGKEGAAAVGSYAELLGINTALMGQAVDSLDNSGKVNYPESDPSSFFDANMPAILQVTVGERTFDVKVCKTNCGDAEKVAAAIVRQVNEQHGSTLLAWDSNDIKGTTNPGTFALYAVTGEPLRVVDKGYGDPRFSEYTGGVAMQLGIAAGVSSSNNEIKYSDTLGPGSIRISSPGHNIDIPVLASDTMHDLANRIRDYAGDWLDVSFSTTVIGSDDGLVSLSLSAKDGSALAIYDVVVDDVNVANTVAKNIGISNALVGEDIKDFDFSTIDETNGIFTITVNGASHTIDLLDTDTFPHEVIINSVEELAETINMRFQGQDIRAEVLTLKDSDGNVVEKKLALYSPKGYTFKVGGSDTTSEGTPAIFGFPVGNDKSPGYANNISSVTSTGALKDDDEPGPGIICISTSSGFQVEIPVGLNDTVEDIAESVRSIAGDEIEVVFFDSNGSDPGGDVALSFTARDGSAITIIDVNGTVASQLGMETGDIVTGLLPVPDVLPAITEDDTFEFVVDGETHSIPLFDNATPPNQIINTYAELVDAINAHFQGQDIKAEIVTFYDNVGNPVGDRIVMSSPKGYAFELEGDAVAALGFTVTSVAARNAPNASPYNQLVTHRTGNNQKETDFFGVLDNLIDCVQGGHVDGITDTMIEQLDNWMNTLLKTRAQVGALTNRYSTTIDRLTSNNTGYNDLHTQTVGVDLAEVITQYEMASSIYEASLAAIARIMQPTLLDFLR